MGPWCPERSRRPARLRRTHVGWVWPCDLRVRRLFFFFNLIDLGSHGIDLTAKRSGTIRGQRETRAAPPLRLGKSQRALLHVGRARPAELRGPCPAGPESWAGEKVDEPLAGFEIRGSVSHRSFGIR